ncbi:MAG TPA: VOC family protein [Actinomycetota bacterium]|nr:VOC family protein [Actinomycetota bacterium]
MLEATTAPAAPYSIAAATGVGAVHLGVTDGEAAKAFYGHVVGLTLLSETEEELRFGSPAGRELVVLVPGSSRPVVERTTGLYHLALLLPDRRELARVIGRLASIRYPQAPTDHTMTKSDYLSDPDGNGIEIYVESPEDGFFGMENGDFLARDTAGNLRSGRDPMDVDEMLSHLEPGDRLDAPLPAETRMGHVHLHVRDVQEAVDFYHGVIGFDVMGMAQRWGAAFVSAGGYHHHLGLNIWAGQGAPPRPVDAAGLRHFTIELPDEASLAEVAARLAAAGVTLVEHPAPEAPLKAPDQNPEAPLKAPDQSQGWWLQDPSHNRIHLTTGPDAN